MQILGPDKLPNDYLRDDVENVVRGSLRQIFSETKMPLILSCFSQCLSKKNMYILLFSMIWKISLQASYVDFRI